MMVNQKLGMIKKKRLLPHLSHASQNFFFSFKRINFVKGRKNKFSNQFQKIISQDFVVTAWIGDGNFEFFQAGFDFFGFFVPAIDYKSYFFSWRLMNSGHIKVLKSGINNFHQNRTIKVLFFIKNQHTDQHQVLEGKKIVNKLFT